MATSYGTDPRDLLRGGSRGAANQQMLDAAQRTLRAAPSGVTTRPAANGVADAARQLTGIRVVPPQTPMQSMAESLRTGTPTGPAAPTGPTNPSFAGGNPSPQAQAWQASRAAAPTASSAPPVGSAPAAPAAAAQAAPKAGGLRGAWEATKAFPGRVASGVRSALSTGAGIARAGVGPALALTPSRLANGELTPEILSAFDDAMKNGYTGTKTLPGVGVMPNGSRARENIYGRGNPKLSSQSGGTGQPQGASTPAPGARAPAAPPQPGSAGGQIKVTRQANGNLSFSGSGPIGTNADGSLKYDLGNSGYVPGSKGGTFNVMPAGSFGGTAPSMGMRLNEARMAAANRGDFDAVARSYGGNFAGGSGRQSGLRGGYTSQRVEGRMGYTRQEARDLLKQAMTKQPGESRADFATRSNAALKALGLEVDERGNIRTNDTSRANNEATNSTTRRGQDMTAAERQAERQAEREAALRERQINADIWELSGRNAVKAADIALSMGRDPGMFMGVASNAQTLDYNAGRNAMTSLEPFMRPDKNGNITDAERARVRGIAQSVVPGYLTMSEREQREVQPRVNAAMKLIQGLNDRNNTSWSQALRFDGDNPELTRVPDFGRNAKLSEVGAWDAAWTPGGVSRNDYKIEMANGQTVFLPRSSVDEEVLNFLAEMGVDIGRRNK